MLFSSLTFLFVFLPVVLLLHYFPVFESESKEKYKQNFILLLASLLFYAWGEPVYIVLMLLSIYFNFNIGIDLEKQYGNERKRKAILVFSVIFNLAVLGFFKYAGFLTDTLNSLFSLELNYTPLPLPVGISFYTFQAMSYVIDVYRKDAKAQYNFLPFALYIAMFPQLIAGPIVQYTDIEKQLEERTCDLRKFAIGIIFFIRGLGKKVIFANSVGKIFTEITAGNISSLSSLTAWIGIFAYTLQIYFDFSGYSDMAIGLGKMFGFDLTVNFNFPYTADSIRDFWKRWHISLSSWFRDYVYIPLGGNRCKIPRQIFNISVVWLLTGLWHGANWNFVAWGAYYGILLIFEKFVFGKVLDKIPSFVRRSLTMILVMIGWVFFSMESFADAGQYLLSMFGSAKGFMDTESKYYLSSNFIPLVIMSLSAFGFFRDMPKPKNKSVRFASQAVIYTGIFVMCIICLVSETYNPFLYFRF